MVLRHLPCIERQFTRVASGNSLLQPIQVNHFYLLMSLDTVWFDTEDDGEPNIAMRTLLTRQDWVRTGALSVRPDVSDHETKAARPARYAELRWSSDTSPSL